MTLATLLLMIAVVFILLLGFKLLLQKVNTIMATGVSSAQALADLQNAIAALQNSVTALQTADTNITNAIQALQAQVAAGGVDPNAVEAVVAQLQTAQQAIASVTSSLNTDAGTGS